MQPFIYLFCVATCITLQLSINGSVKREGVVDFSRGAEHRTSFHLEDRVDVHAATLMLVIFLHTYVEWTGLDSGQATARLLPKTVHSKAPVVC